MPKLMTKIPLSSCIYMSIQNTAVDTSIEVCSSSLAGDTSKKLWKLNTLHDFYDHITRRSKFHMARTPLTKSYFTCRPLPRTNCWCPYCCAEHERWLSRLSEIKINWKWFVGTMASSMAAPRSAHSRRWRTNEGINNSDAKPLPTNFYNHLL
jgi:hypothetical protein